ncbi:SpoIIE family protein phosphatase [Stutzerimonas sp. Brlt_13]|jgi:protein phosphatase|uniref:SpoIIE family protein phosphatase n=1 Tax=Stutzerimonas stutzeri TaxID=316 RepID=A0A4S2BG09_STUST|nr:SpoIIE family protein phosphatase [Stutzerimonas stutzeri]MBA4690476.1 serine/threonine-protein phosphatase [Pseudomonas sp.]NMY63591.1 serine/threonine-protein phosphatase [Pseudomonas sp. WS 5018]AEA84994.1 phosphoprotein phosphatase [Stutzerimonas stutzeri DSM 4166]AWK98547.1 serine/threonine-protein phosphatase [Stutzerimonas stutzeri]MBD9410667.1 SpoIIE family protein phosphatase [Stutzerimonas stutzeri]
MQPTLSDSLLDYAGNSSPGRRRSHNEDALLCAPTLGLWAIADGMGGHQCGEVASSLALVALRQAVEDGEPLETAVHLANQAVLEAATDDGMGTTLVAAHFNGSDFELAWVGDSRAYLVSADGIAQLTRDHSWVQMMIDAGELEPAAAQGHAWRNIILRCLGRETPLEVGIAAGSLKPDELLLLCSDGLTNELTDAQIQASCTFADTLENLVEQLIEQANAHGGRDNISCIVIGRTAQPQATESRGRRFINMLLKPLKS